MTIAVNFAIGKEPEKKFRALTGFEPVTSAIPGSSNMNYFIHTSHRFTPHGQLIDLAQLVEHRTGIAEVTGSNSVEALIFRVLLSNCLIYCDDHSLSYRVYSLPLLE